MKIGVLGATGLTGKRFVQQALDASHHVVAVVRTPSKMEDIVHDNLTVVEGDLFSATSLKQHLEGVDAVVSTIGFGLWPRTCTGYSDATKCVVEVMRELSCRRLVVMHAWHTHKDSRNDPINDAWYIRWLLIPLIRPLLDNMRETEEFLDADCQDIDYTVVSPPGLANQPETDFDFVVRDDFFKVPGESTQIQRADVARYIMKILPDESSYRKIHAIATATPK